jgi:hypothetical protein
MSDFTLTPAGLAFMLTLMNAKGIPGVDVSHLFPTDPTERQALLEQGAHDIAAQGYFRIENRQFHDMNPLLPLAVAGVVAPEQIIHTRAYTGADEYQAGHYLSSQVVVEFYVSAGEQYRLVVLDSVETAIRTIAHNVGVVPSAQETALTLTIPQEAQQGDIRAAVSAALAQSDIAPADGTAIIRAISDLERVAEVDLAQVLDGEILRQQSVLLFRIQDTIGMLNAVRDGATILTVPASATFERTLLEGVHALQAMRQAVV